MPLKIFIVATFYTEFLEELYALDPGLAEMDFDSQRDRVFASGFGIGDAYSEGLQACGCEAQETIVNADHLQARWANEHGVETSGNVHHRRRQIVAAQIEHYRPDVLYVFEWCPLGDAFLQEMKSRVRLLVGQIASNLRPDRSFAAYDLMISSWPPIVDHFRKIGHEAVPVRLGFNRRILDRLSSAEPEFDVTFVGGLGAVHGHRIDWLERLLADVEVDVFGYGLENTESNSPIRGHHRGPAWGMKMYQVIQRSRITLNLHGNIEVEGVATTNLANNMRLFEATGVGTCLITDAKSNLGELFTPGEEVVTYRDAAECVDKIRHYLSDESKRVAVARAGQQRTLGDHCYTDRMRELFDILTRRL